VMAARVFFIPIKSRAEPGKTLVPSQATGKNVVME
jgi:hypothetical protein